MHFANQFNAANIGKMSDTVKFQIKITGSDSFKEVEVSANDLAEAIDKVKNHAHNLNEKLLNANQAAQLFDQVSAAVQVLDERGLRGDKCLIVLSIFYLYLQRCFNISDMVMLLSFRGDVFSLR